MEFILIFITETENITMAIRCIKVKNIAMWLKSFTSGWK